jgi:type VI secretion system protein ImpA
VISLAGETIAKRSKDLQLAVWLVDAHVRKERFTALTPGFDFLRGFVDDFWDTLYPEIDDGDVEERAGLLAWLGLKLEEPLRLLPLAGGFSWSHYKESLTVGTEADAKTQELRQKREQLLGEGKISGEQWTEAVVAAKKVDCERLEKTLGTALESLDRLGEVCDRRFPADPPSFRKTRSAMEEISGLVRAIIFEKGGPATAVTPPRPPEPVPAPAPVPAPITPSAPATQQIAASEPVLVAAASAASDSIDPLDLADAERRLSAICRFLRKNDT